MVVKLEILPIEHIIYTSRKKQSMLRDTGYSIAFLATFLRDSTWTVERIVELSLAVVYLTP
jgi:hypothetical protein